MPDNDSESAPLSLDPATALDDLIGELDDPLEGNGKTLNQRSPRAHLDDRFPIKFHAA